jgi:hypothetical protein
MSGRSRLFDDPGNLLKACVMLDPKTKNRLNIDPQDNADIAKIVDQIPICPSADRCGLLSERNGWNCGN